MRPDKRLPAQGSPSLFARKYSLVLCLVSVGCALWNACGGKGPATDVVVPTPLVITSGNLPPGRQGTAYGSGGSGFTLTASGGVAPYSWSWAADSGSSLPPGLTLSSNLISGTPSAAASYNVVVTVTDSQSPSVKTNAPYTITIAAPLPPLAITSTPIAGTALALYGSPHRLRDSRGQFVTITFFSLTATGGTGQYSWTWTAAAGSMLPPGLGCCSHFFQTAPFPFRVGVSVANIIWGKPTQPGTYQVELTVSDSGAPDLRTSKTFPIVIQNPPPPVINTSPTLPIGTLNSPYVGFTFTASQGLPPLTWSETGALPAGIQLSGDGVLSGKPTTSGTFPVTLTARDSAGQDSAPQGFVLKVLSLGFVPTGDMASERADHTATLLSGGANDGKVLVVGADAGMAELFDPATGTFSATGRMETGRVFHTATRLASGKVLIAGGSGDSVNLSSAELFDPASGTFTRTATDMKQVRTQHTATLLNDGTVLITGGTDAGGNPTATAELFDPATQTFTFTGNLKAPRSSHTATRLVGGANDGKVLVVGGDGVGTAELFDPATGTFAATGSMTTSRFNHTATLLNSGLVLIAGGQGGDGNIPVASAELFEPATGTFALTTGEMNDPRAAHTATLLSNGQVLITGGFEYVSAVRVLSAAELFDPATGQFALTADLTNIRQFHAATRLANGKVLVTGGYDLNGVILRTAELYQ